MNSKLTEAKLKKQRDAEAKDRLAKSYRSYDARLRSGWDDYGGAITAALNGDAARLTDLLRARRPLTDDDFERLADLIEQQGKKGRGQPKKHAAREATAIARAMLNLYADDALALLADFMEQQSKKERDQPKKHTAAEATAIARELLDLVAREATTARARAIPERTPGVKRAAVAAYAASAIERITGTPVTAEEVLDRLRRGRKGRT